MTVLSNSGITEKQVYVGLRSDLRSFFFLKIETFVMK